ncbi:MAG: Crp/Fnr family transcriptional regulator [Chloroflexi bacterium]|nr:Crp/Fnr family transcriptional regulator [Chloroflexota bacterium]
MDTAEFFRTIPYFTKLSPGEIDRLGRDTTEQRFDRGEILFLEGEPCLGLYVVREGQVRIFKTSPDGKEQVLTMAGPGATFNDVPIFDGGPNPASASAFQPSRVYIVSKATMISLIGNCPMALSLLRGFAGRLRHLTVLVEDLSFRRVVSRLAKILLESAVSTDVPVSGRQYTQQEMAAMVGTARDVVGRALRDLEREGAIKMDGRRIVVTNSGKLKEIV